MRTPGPTRPRVTERTFILGMWFDVDEACHVTGMFAHEQIAFASNAEDIDAAVARLREASDSVASKIWHLDYSWPLHDDLEAIAPNVALVRRLAPTLDIAAQLREASTALSHLRGTETAIFAADHTVPVREEPDDDADDLAGLLASLQDDPA